jgi:hypothetical protein
MKTHVRLHQLEACMFVWLLTVDALNMCSLPKYLCRYSRIVVADRRAQVAASTNAPAEVMLGMKLGTLKPCRVIHRYSAYHILLSALPLEVFR